MITYHKIEPPTVEVWNKDGFFARVNEYEFYNIRIQICRERADDFYIIFEGEKYVINDLGRLPVWPDGCMDLISGMLDTLFAEQDNVLINKKKQ